MSVRELPDASQMDSRLTETRQQTTVSHCVARLRKSVLRPLSSAKRRVSPSMTTANPVVGDDPRILLPTLLPLPTTGGPVAEAILLSAPST